MKGDFSRLTFQPRRQYQRVLQQQGRPQIDADWNEQVAILMNRLQSLTGDLTGDSHWRAGAPSGLAGFEIEGIATETDNFTISAGRYYVDGLACENARNTTYLEQPHWSGTKLDREGISLVYLDAWEAVATALDDPELLEPALSGIETSLRSHIVWQIRTLRLATHHNPRAPDFKALQAEAHEAGATWRAQRRGMLAVRLSGGASQAGREPARGGASGHFRGPENLLYRVEIHEGGRAGKASFKWSHDNGTPLLGLAQLEGSTARVAPMSRKAAADLAPGTWVEVSNRHDRALGRSRPMVQIVGVDAASGRIELSGAPEPGSAKSDDHGGLGLRRWDQQSTPATRRGEIAGPLGVPLTEGEGDADWLDLEDGIQIQFQAARDPAHHYRTGDYWLIPARTADEGMLLCGQAPRPPDGVDHVYAPIGLYAPQLSQVLADFRPTFQPLAAMQDQLNALSDSLEDLRRQVEAAKPR